MLNGDFLDWRRGETVANMCDFLQASHDRAPERLFSADQNLQLTYAQTMRAVMGFGTKHADTVEGQDVAIFMANSTAALISYFAVLWAGGRPALINAATPAALGRSILEKLTPAMVLADKNLEFHDQALLVDAAMVKDWTNATPIASRCGSGTTPACSFYTGGTTGVPKRIVYTHEMVVAASERMVWGWPMHDGETYLPIAPFSHIYGFLMGVCLPVQCGGTSVIPPRFHPGEVLDLMEKEKVTVLGGGPPAIYQALMSDPNLASRDLSALRVCPGGGAPFPVDVHNRWKNITGLDIFEGYGMTEIAPITINTVERGARAGAAGKAVPDTDVSIVDLETGKTELPTGKAGEIRVRGPHGMTEYANNPAETKIAIRDGWIYTGDIGAVDEEGFLIITDRKKDMIIHKGFNVFPREVEEALMAHAAVSAVCVVGKPDTDAGELIVAYVARQKDAPVSAEDLTEHCKQHLLAYRLPNVIEFRDALPLTLAGKVDRMALREAAKTIDARKPQA